MSISLRDYQQEVVDVFFQKLKENIKRQLVILPTGAGKTVVAAAIGKRFHEEFHSDDPILFIAHRDELLRQTADKFSLVWEGVRVGLVKGSSNEQDADLITASTATLVRGREIKKPKLVIYDEAHHSRAKKSMEFLARIGVLGGDIPMLGITATPNRADGQALGDVFEEVVYEKKMVDMILDGYLCDVRGKRIHIEDLDFSGIGMVGDDFDLAELGEMMENDEISEAIVSAYLEHGENRKTVVFTVTVQQATDIAKIFCEHGVPASVVHGGMSPEHRSEVLEQFTHDKLRVLVNCLVLTEGFDRPDVSCVLIARPTRSESLYIQMVGRGTRLYPGKEDLLVLDTVGASDDKTLMTVSQLFLPPEEAPSKEEEIKENESVREYHERLEKAVERENIRKRKLHEEKINLFANRARFHWTSMGEDGFVLSWRDEKYAFLFQDGNEWWALLYTSDKLVPVYSNPLSIEYAQGVAESFLQTISTNLIKKDARWRNESITPKQKSLLRRRGVTEVDGWTKGQANEALTALDGKKIVQEIIRKIDFPSLQDKLKEEHVQNYQKHILDKIRKNQL